MAVADDGEELVAVMDRDALSILEEGAFFGEMAYLLDEYRSAWAVALTECTVFQLPPPVFERYLAHDADASSRLVSSLAARLKANNDLLARGGQL